MINIYVQRKSLGSSENVLICSAYLPGDDVLPNEFIALMEYCLNHNEHLIVVCDAYSHHTIWGNTDINERSKLLLEALVKNFISALSTGNQPTFVTRVRRQVLDLTLSTGFISGRIVDWENCLLNKCYLVMICLLLD